VLAWRSTGASRLSVQAETKELIRMKAPRYRLV
jgi:hypothetical protein